MITHNGSYFFYALDYEYDEARVDLHSYENASSTDGYWLAESEHLIDVYVNGEIQRFFYESRDEEGEWPY